MDQELKEAIEKTERDFRYLWMQRNTGIAYSRPI